LQVIPSEKSERVGLDFRKSSTTAKAVGGR
jgi:hypothetical protein